MELTRREFSLDGENPVLKAFLDNNTELLNSVTADGKTAQVQLSMLTADHMIRWLLCFYWSCKWKCNLCLCRASTSLQLSTLARAPKPLRLPCSSPCLFGSSRLIRSGQAPPTASAFSNSESISLIKLFVCVSKRSGTMSRRGSRVSWSLTLRAVLRKRKWEATRYLWRSLWATVALKVEQVVQWQKGLQLYPTLSLCPWARNWNLLAPNGATFKQRALLN